MRDNPLLFEVMRRRHGQTVGTPRWGVPARELQATADTKREQEREKE